jgi:hypothetical protein
MTKFGARRQKRRRKLGKDDISDENRTHEKLLRINFRKTKGGLANHPAAGVHRRVANGHQQEKIMTNFLVTESSTFRHRLLALGVSTSWHHRASLQPGLHFYLVPHQTRGLLRRSVATCTFGTKSRGFRPVFFQPPLRKVVLCETVFCKGF